MTDGTYTYYTIQHKDTRQSPWLKRGPIMRRWKSFGRWVKNEWTFSSWDFFGFARWGQARSDSDEIHDVWEKTDDHGWWHLGLARRALKRAQNRDAKGDFDSRDSYKTFEQVQRHAFRIVKMKVSQKTEVVT